MLYPPLSFHQTLVFPGANPPAFGNIPARAAVYNDQDASKVDMWSSMLTVVKRAFALFAQERADRRGAALAFYTVTSIAPILVIVIAIAGLVFGQQAASGALFEQFRSLLGPDGAEFLQTAIASSSSGEGQVAAIVTTFVTLTLGASGVFLELEDGLNALWSVKVGSGFRMMARARVASVGLVIALGFVLMVSLIIDAALKAVVAYMPLGSALYLFASTAASLILMTALFAAIFKYLPARHITWKEVFPGAAVTAVLFEVGRFLIGWYLGRGDSASALGAAGAILGLLFWVYYSAQIFLFGAALTVVYATAKSSVG